MTATRKISVIVPLYNVESHVLGLIQTLSDQDSSLIEAIFVNDGSMDTTVKTLRLVLEGNTLKAPWRILNKPNGGLSDARNFGLLHSKLPYVTFLDPDDEISKNFYGELMERMLATNASVALSSSVEVWPGGRTRSCIYDDAVHEINDSSTWLLSYDWSACTKLFSRDLFEENKFDVGLRYEDLAMIPYLMAIAGRVCVSQKAIYYYHRRVGSITLGSDIKKEIEILDSIDKISARLRRIDKESLVWDLMQKVLVTGFIPSVTTRYSAAQSRDFALKIREYLIHREPHERARHVRPRDLLTSLFLVAPGPSRWIITALHKFATLIAKSYN